MAATLVFKLTGGASNSDGDASLGGVGSSVTLDTTRLNNLFDDVTASEASSGDVEFRALDIYNSGDATATSVNLYIDSQTTSGDTDIAVGLDSTTQDTSDGGDEETVPSGVSFTQPTSGSPLTVSDITTGSRQRFWIRRTVNSSAGNIAEDVASLGVTYA